eukprot:TRINITY_DN9801_c0_g2_i2.p1 TRINITY_DN9801_c0_g2~~TRINITY_DN9801_c0_g2_i2.p1  ORF type:complete len:455 (-),score=111.37 TRINITY_DN9801_c0_g2_i2:17-1381(-)
MEELGDIASHLENNFEDLCAKLKNEAAGLKALESFLKEFSKLNESYCKSLLSLLSHLRSQPGPVSSISTAINVLSKELEDFAENSINTSKEMSTDITGSLELFKHGFDKRSSKLMKSGNKILAELMEGRNRAADAHNNYTNTAKDLELMQSEFKELLESVKEASASFNVTIEQKTNEILDLQELNKRHCGEYKEAVESVNAVVKYKYNKYCDVLEDSVEVEKGRIEFVKEIINRSLENMRHMGRQWLDKVTSVLSVVDYINSESDLKLFIKSLKNVGENLLFTPLKFTEYKPLSPPIFTTTSIIEIEDDYFGGEKGSEPGTITVILEETISNLINGKVLSLTEKAMVIEQLHKPLGKHIFVKTISQIPYCTFMPYESFKVFGELVKYLLSVIMKEKNCKAEELETVLSVGKAIYTKLASGKIVYLFSELAKHGVWQAHVPVSYTHLTLPTICSV